MATIVLVEDDVDVARLLAAVLAEAGHEVRLAADGLAALEVVRAAAPDLVLVDVSLPGSLDGLEVTRLLRADVLAPGVPVLAVTARSGAADRRRGEEVGVTDYVVKPYDVEDLVRRVAEHLEGPR